MSCFMQSFKSFILDLCHCIALMEKSQAGVRPRNQDLERTAMTRYRYRQLKPRSYVRSCLQFEFGFWLRAWQVKTSIGGVV